MLPKDVYQTNFKKHSCQKLCEKTSSSKTKNIRRENSRKKHLGIAKKPIVLSKRNSYQTNPEEEISTRKSLKKHSYQKMFEEKSPPKNTRKKSTKQNRCRDILIFFEETFSTTIHLYEKLFVEKFLPNGKNIPKENSAEILSTIFSQ